MIGIEIIGTGEFLELFEDTAIDLKLRNPLFTEDIIPGSISLPFDVPGGQDSPRNSKLLKNPDVIGNMQATVKTAARLWYDGNPWKVGELIVQKATPRVISLNFRFGLTTTANDFKALRIRDIIDEEVVMGTAGTWHKKVAIRLTEIVNKHKITINGKDYEYQGYSSGNVINGTNYGFANSLDGVAEAFSQCINTTFPNGVVATYAAGYFTVRVTDVNTLDLPLNIQIEEKQHWLVNSTEFEDDYNGPIKDWLDDHYHDTFGGIGGLGDLLSGGITTKVRFPTVCNKLYDKDLIYRDAVNLVDDTGFVLNKPVSGASFEPENRSSICPFVMWRYLTTKVLNAIGLLGGGDFYLNDTDFQKAMLPHSNSLDVLALMVGTKEWVACKDRFNLRDFVPDWTVPEFLKALQRRFNVGIDFNERTRRIEFVKREGIHADLSYKDITSICAPIEENNPPEVTGVRIKTIRNTKDLLSEEDVFESGDPNLEIASEITGWPSQENRNFIDGTTWEVPVARIRKDTSISPAMLFYVERESTGTLEFEYGTADIDLSDCTFAFAGASGMANVRWKRHLRFLLNRKLLPVNIAFEFRDLLALDWKKKVRPMEGLNCFINAIDVRLTMHGVERSRCELWTTDLGILP